MLTDGQKAFFESFGYVLMRGLLSPKEVAAITCDVDEEWAEARKANPDEEDLTLGAIVENRRALLQLVEDDRIYNPISKLLGPDFIWCGSEGHHSSHSTHGFHPDRTGPHDCDYLRIKLMMYLDPLDKDSGCLRVIPGSHRPPLHFEIEPDERHQMSEIVRPYDVRGDEMPCAALESKPGDIVFFNQCLWHGVFNATPGRRYMAMKFAQRPTRPEHIASLQHYTPDAFNPHNAFIHSDRPALQRMVDGLAEMKPDESTTTSSL